MAAASSSRHAAIQSASNTPELRRNSSADSANEVCPDVVAADHEGAEVGKRQALKQRQLRHQSGAIDQPPDHRRQPQRDRRADASKRSD